MATAKAGAPKVPDIAGTPAALPAGWSTPVNISNNSTWSEGPYLALDAKSNVYVCWTDWYGGVGARRDMMFNTNKTGKWGAARSNQLGYTAIDDVGFPQVTVTQDGKSAIYAWMDGYFNTASPRMAIQGEELAYGAWGGLSLISAAVSNPSTYVSLATSPVDNTVCFVWQQDMDPGFAVAYQYLDGTTGRMSDPELVFEGQGGGQYLPNVFVDSKGKAHCVYIARIGDAVVWYTSNPTPKNLKGWTTPVPLTIGTGLDWSYPMVAASGDGDAYVVWQEDHALLEAINFKYQKNGVWQPTELLTTTTHNPSQHPSIAVDPVTEDVYVTWTTLTGGGLGNVWLRTFEMDKILGKQVWSAPVQLTTSGQAFKSCVRVTKDPDIHIVYEDNRDIWYVSKLAPRLTVIQPPTVASKINRVLFSSDKTLTISFAKNPENDDATLKEYRLYYKKAEDSAYTVLATFAPTAALEYVMKKLPVNQKYNFMASVVNKEGLELITTSVISD
jgi:hypothetical protein